MLYKNIRGVPDFECKEYAEKKTMYCVCIPIINEKENIKLELLRARMNKVHTLADIIICDGGSTDGGTDDDMFRLLHGRETGDNRPTLFVCGFIRQDK